MELNWGSLLGKSALWFYGVEHVPKEEGFFWKAFSVLAEIIKHFKVNSKAWVLRSSKCLRSFLYINAMQ